MSRLYWMLAIVAVVGCGGSGGPPMHRVEAQLELPGDQVEILAGHYIEARLENQPDIVASGEITPEGKVKLETVQGGEVRTGALEGKYQVRIVLADDDPVKRRQAAEKVDARNLYYETSGLTFQVPSENIVMRLQARR